MAGAGIAMPAEHIGRDPEVVVEGSLPGRPHEGKMLAAIQPALRRRSHPRGWNGPEADGGRLSGHSHPHQQRRDGRSRSDLRRGRVEQRARHH